MPLQDVPGPGGGRPFGLRGESGLAWAEEGDAGEVSKELLDALEELTALLRETVRENSVSGTEFS